MCGIAGFIALPVSDNGANLERVRRMTDVLAHRGPDGQGIWHNRDGIYLGHRRLSIIDLSPAGAQPMIARDGKSAVVFNGEIYNFKELRSRLEAEGVTFAGTSDTEVLLAALHSWGPARTLPQLNGMFAFAYWDERRKELWLARDRIGEKPLYYAKHRGVVMFASELKSLRAHPDFIPDIDHSVLPHYFRVNYIPAPRTIYQNTWKLLPGHCLCLCPGQSGPLEPSSYWTLNAILENANPVLETGRELIDRAEAVLRRSVRMRMVSDRPVGCFLSGGIDSSMVTALMQAEMTSRVRTFTIGYGDANMNEADDAERVARHLGTAHTTFMVQSADVLAMIPRIPDIYDEPYADSSQIPTCLLSQLTVRHVTVALTGDGGDEAFGGYNRYVWTNEVWNTFQKLPANLRALIASLLFRLRPNTWNQVLGFLAVIIPKRYWLRSPGDKLHKMAGVALATDEKDLYRRLISLNQNPSEICYVGEGLLPFESLEVHASLRRPEERMMFWDSATYLPDDILVKLDRAAMHVGLEGRIPFLDNDVMAFAWSLPFDAKVRGGVGKRIIRDVLGRYVPKKLFERPKTGFGIPIGEWLRGPLRSWAEDLLTSKRLSECVKPEPIWQLYQQHLSGSRNTEYQLWSALMLSAWLERWQGEGQQGGKSPVLSALPVEIRTAPPAPITSYEKGRVVFLMNSLGGAGAEKQVVLTANALIECGYKAEIYTLQTDSHSERLEALLRDARRAGVYIHRPKARQNWFRSSLAACRTSLTDREDAVLWTWGYRADLVALTAIRSRAPRISSLRSASSELVHRRALLWKWFDRSCARYISNSWLNVEQLEEIVPTVRSKCRVLYNAVEPHALEQPPVLLPSTIDRLEIVMLGNVRVHVKGYDLAVEMMKRAKQEGLNVRLRIAGLLLEPRKFKTLIASAGLGDMCEYVGPVSEPYEFLRSGHLFLLFSRFEGLPNALLEAMAIGLPCIASRVGDVDRFAVDGRHLRVIEVGDVGAALTAIREARTNWADYRAMGQSARGLIQSEFSAAAFKTKLVDSIGDLMPKAVS